MCRAYRLLGCVGHRRANQPLVPRVRDQPAAVHVAVVHQAHRTPKPYTAAISLAGCSIGCCFAGTFLKTSPGSLVTRSLTSVSHVRDRCCNTAHSSCGSPVGILSRLSTSLSCLIVRQICLATC